MSTDQTARLRQELQAKMNKVPDAVRNGSVQTVRNWMRIRTDAEKVLKKKSVTAAELIGAISRLE